MIEMNARIAEALASGLCSLTRERSDGGGGPCPRPATRITPVEVTENGVLVRRWGDVVCDHHDPFHYGALQPGHWSSCRSEGDPGHSILISEMETLDWDSDPRVLRYDREETMGAFLVAIDNLDAHQPPSRSRGFCRSQPSPEEQP